MDAGVIIAIVVIALLILAVILLAGRKRSKEQERLARVQTDARRDDAQYERHTAAEKLREAEEAEEHARRARARAEEHHERAAEVDPDRDDDAAAHDAHGADPAQNGRQSEYDSERR